jgi:hypothetical protein
MLTGYKRETPFKRADAPGEMNELVRGAMNSCMIEFEIGGFRAVVSRNALVSAVLEFGIALAPLPRENYGHHGCSSPV